MRLTQGWAFAHSFKPAREQYRVFTPEKLGYIG
jgi:hypothetical protein